jgi:hypothetical protein
MTYHIYKYKQDTYVYTIIPILDFVTPINFEGIFGHFVLDLVDYMLCSTIRCILRWLSLAKTFFFYILLSEVSLHYPMVLSDKVHMRKAK